MRPTEPSTSVHYGQNRSDISASDSSCSDVEMECMEEAPLDGGSSEEGSEGENRDENSEDEDDQWPHIEAGDPDDPDDPVDPVNNPEGDNNPNGDPNFGLNNPYLNVRCRMLHDMTVREVIVLVLVLAVKHSATYVFTIDIFKTLNVILGRKYLPESKDKLWALVGRKHFGIRKHYYCGNCLREIENFEAQPERFQCVCNFWNVKKYSRCFLTMDLERQLHYLLHIPGFADTLNHRQTREKKTPENMEDVYDGSRYRRMQEPGQILSNNDNYSYIWNGDGLRLTRTSNEEAFPIYIRLNELPPIIRQKYIFLAGIWVDRQAPNMNLLLDKFVQQANRLSLDGVHWTTSNGENKQSRFVPFCCTADSKARCQVLFMTEPTGHHACGFCNHEGVQARGIKFPNWPANAPHQNLPEPMSRTHATIVQDMLQAANEGPVNGFKGPSQIMNLDHFDMKEGFSTDDLHPVFVGVVKDYMEELFEGDTINIGTDRNIAIINRRWKAIKLPTSISRKPRDIKTWKKWRGTEFKNFLFYGLPCLEGIGVLRVDPRPLENLQRLAEAVFNLSKDSISEEDLLVAEENLMIFSVQFEDIFGVEKMKFNVHMLLHLVEVVRLLGNLWVHTTLNFESWNHRLKDFVTSSNGAVDQVSYRLLLSSFVSAARFDERISERVRLAMESFLMKTRLDNARRVGNVYLLGKADFRALTEEERETLQIYGVNFRNVVDYKRAFFNNIECRSARYVREGKSDNSNIFTWDDMYAHIESILVINPDDEDEACGMVCQVYTSLQPVPHRSYIYRIMPDNRNLVWVPFHDLRTLAVKITILDNTFIARLPNHLEID